MSSYPKHMPADERRAATVQTVIELAGAQNPSDITTAAIAKHMGLTQGALFRHFANKDAILQAVIEWVAQEMTGRLGGAIQGIGSSLAALQAVFKAHVEFVSQYPGVPRMLMGEMQRAEDTQAKQMARALMRRYRDLIEQLIEQGKQLGELAGGVDAEAGGLLFIGAVQGLIIQSLLAGDMSRIHVDAPRVFEVYRRAIVDGR